MAGLLSLELIMMMGIGVLVSKLKMVKEDFVPQLSAIVMNVVLPCMIISSMVGALSVEEMLECVWLLVLAAALLAVLFCVGQLFFVLKKRTVSGRILRFGFMFSNFTFMGVPVIQVLYGDQMSAYFMVFLIVVRAVFYYSITPLMRNPELEPPSHSVRDRLKNIFSPTMVAMLVAIFLNVIGVTLPSVIYDVLKSVGSMCTPLGMLICGISLSRYSPKQLLRPYQLWVVAVRNLLIPGLCLLACLALRLEPYMTRIAVIFCCLPFSTMTNTFTVRFNPDNPKAHFESAGVVLATTIASIATIPLWAEILSRVLA